MPDRDRDVCVGGLFSGWSEKGREDDEIDDRIDEEAVGHVLHPGWTSRQRHFPKFFSGGTFRELLRNQYDRQPQWENAEIGRAHV